MVANFINIIVIKIYLLCDKYLQKHIPDFLNERRRIDFDFWNGDL